MRFSEFTIINEDEIQLPTVLNSANDIASLQKVLVAYRFLNITDVSGQLDQVTKNAIMAAQQAVDLQPSGVPDETFMNRVNMALMATPEMPRAIANISASILKQPLPAGSIPAAMFSDGGASVMWNNREKGADAMMTPPRTSPRKEKYNPYNYQPDDSEEDIILSPKSYAQPNLTTPPKSEIDNFRANNNTSEVTPKKSYAGKLEPGFIEKVEDIAGKLGIDPNILMKIMQHETGGTFSPKATNPDGHHVGLIQFDTYKTAPGLGTSKQKLLNMTQLEQLDYVYKYYKQVGVEPGMDSAEIYMLTFLPWSRGKDNNTVIGQAGGGMLGNTGLSKKNLWKANPPFRKWAQDKGQDYYTKGDVIDYYRHYKPT